MDATYSRKIILEDLQQGYPGLTPEQGASHRQAALVCLASKDHTACVLCEMKSLKETCSILRLSWKGDVTDQMRNTWFDRREASEMGAAGLAILVVLAFTDYTILRRTDIDEDSGVDYWLSKESLAAEASENFLQEDARLEVAGRRSVPSTNSIENLVRTKLERSKKSDETGKPAYVVVVEFSRPVIYFETRMADL